MRLPLFFCLAAFLAQARLMGQLAGTAPLQPATGDERSKEMVAGIDRFLMRQIEESVTKRETLWKRDVSSVAAYLKSVELNRDHLRSILGVCDADKREAVTALELLSTTERDSKLAETKDYVIHAVRWPVLPGVLGEGLLLRPRGKVKAQYPPPRSEAAFGKHRPKKVVSKGAPNVPPCREEESKHSPSSENAF